MFAIYPVVDKKSVKEHAVVFTDRSDIAEYLADYFTSDRGTEHAAYLVTPSWPDPQLINNLNGCGEDVYFSCRVGKSASDAAHHLRPVHQRVGFAVNA